MKKADIQKGTLNEMKYKLGLIGKVDCTPEENAEFIKLYHQGEKLPDGVYYKTHYQDEEEEDTFYRTVDLLSKEEQLEYIALKQYYAAKTIRNCVIFFAVVALIEFILFLLLL
ncbi:MAG: hypothetical protein IJ333_00020 [Clostridia bacterium]|nr:hypothetical protein [Clostridia bacterium]